MPGSITFVRRINKTSLSEIWEAQSPNGERIAIELMPLKDAQEILEGLAFTRTLGHPNLLRLSGYWPHDGNLFVLMELADVTLKDRLIQLRHERTTFPASELIDHICQIAEALDYLQEMKLVHSAVIPEHMCLVNQKTKLGGLGFLRPLDGPNSSSPTGREQAANGVGQLDTRKADQKCNQFGLAVGYVCLRTGQTQWNPAYLASLADRERAVVIRAMSPQLSERFSSCAALALEFRRVLQDAVRS